MNKPRKKIRVLGERRPELDIARFANALIAFALHQLHAEYIEAQDVAASTDAVPTEEAS